MRKLFVCAAYLSDNPIRLGNRKKQIHFLLVVPRDEDTSKLSTWSKIAVGMARVATALGASTIPEILPSQGQHEIKLQRVIDKELGELSITDFPTWLHGENGSVRNPPPFSLSNIAVKPHSSPGRGPKLHISTARRSPELLSWIAPAVQSTISIRNISPVLISVTGGISGCQRLWSGNFCSHGFFFRSMGITSLGVGGAI
ncbi:hypothetical protein H5410_009052, partial [Solanum commersonii]